MDFALSQELLSLRALAAETVERLLVHEPVFAETGEVPPEVFRQLRELGFYGLSIPEEYGGLGLSNVAVCIVLEELAKLPRAFFRELGVNNGIGSRAILIAGNEDQRHRYLPKLARGDMLAALAVTEPNAGSDVSGIETRAVLNGDHYVLNGRKQFITNGGKADVVTVMAYTDPGKGPMGGITAFLVEKGVPGFIVGRTFRTMEGPPHTVVELIFEDCRVPASQVIGEPGKGFVYAMQTLDEGRIQIAAQAVGMAQRLLDLTRRHALQRRQFGRPIADFQAIQHMLADAATELHAARLMVYHAAWQMDQGRRVPQEAAMAKLFATEMAGRVADRAVQVHGGMGYVSELPVERMYREVRLLRIVEGTSEIQRRIIAKHALREG